MSIYIGPRLHGAHGQFVGNPKYHDGPGVYGIFNTKNGRVYVGSSNNVSGRASNHFSRLEGRTQKRPSRELKADWDKYGRAAFEFVVLEKLSKRASQKTRWAREQYWMDQFPLRYNLGPRADTTEGVRYDEATRHKLADVHKGIRPSAQTRAKMSRSQKKRANAPESKKRLSEVMRQRHANGDFFSEKGRRAISEAAKVRWANPKWRRKTSAAISAAKRRKN